ncbi:NUDIX hydrolase [Phormidesmis priestleyi]
MNRIDDFVAEVGETRVQVAIAILYRENRFLMQLRDNVPNIVYPAHWGMFGGHLEPGETPEIAVRREVAEEIGYGLSMVQRFGCYVDEKVIRYVFHAPLKVELSDLTLMEGWDMQLLTREEIGQGKRYSDRAQQIQPLTEGSQRILLDFIEQAD